MRKKIFKSGILRITQSFILYARFNYFLKPFATIFQKLYCLIKFADWKKKHLTKSTLINYKNRFFLYNDIIKQQQLDEICFIEFGVAKGESINWWLKKISNSKSCFFGFDSFEGIPEDWGTMPKGTYSNNGHIPGIHDPRCKLTVGLFQKSLPNFLQTHRLTQKLVIHFDADLYSSTLFALFSMANHLKKGDILIFDEFDVTTHEFRALQDFEQAYPLSYDLLGESHNYNKIVLKIK